MIYMMFGSGDSGFDSLIKRMLKKKWMHVHAHMHMHKSECKRGIISQVCGHDLVNTL